MGCRCGRDPPRAGARALPATRRCRIHVSRPGTRRFRYRGLP
jgi:hypothetical protein